MVSRAGKAWWWLRAWATLCFTLIAVVVAFVAGLQWGTWVAFAASLAVMAVLAPKAIIFLWLVLPAVSDRQYPNPRGLMIWVYQIALCLTLCLFGVSLITGPLGLTVFCGVCALWTALFWVMIKVASDG